MKMKEYLSQAMTLEGNIQARMEQIARLHAMAERGARLAERAPENAGGWAVPLGQMAALEAELQRDVQAWVAVKREIGGVIESVDKPVYRQLLEYRYLCGWDWRKIASKMHYSIDRVWHIHSEALREMKIPEIPRC